MNKKLLITAGVLAIILITFFVVKGSGDGDESDILVTAQMGTFQIDIVTTGELEAKNSVKVQGPNGLRAARIWQVKLDHIIDEGSVVEKGDYIAKLDNSELVERLKSQGNELQQSLSKHTQTKLDTALELRKARDELINLKFQVEEKKLVLEQSTYEPPATIKQAEIDLEKAEREDKQAQENYKLQYNKAVAQMQEAGAELAEDQNEYDFLQKLSQSFSIMAPEPGMVIYHRDWNGNRIKSGSMIQTWDPTVATLPDLTTMVSKTYVNEVDIRKVKMGQNVQLGLDAFPDKRLTGSVISVANMGEQKPNSDSKVFEVSIQVNESDSTLRPAMTTSNTIIADVIQDVVYIPLECLHSQGDSLSYVIKKSGISFSKHQVVIGATNSNEAVIVDGVVEDDRLYLSLPNGAEDKDVVFLENLPTELSTAN